MLNLSTHQLHVFLVAAETQNFTQAAQRLQMTQPSVSQHIQALEDHFGLPLFVRAGRNIELTDAGMALIPLARELVNLSVHVEETMASIQGDVHGHLIVGCSTSTGRYILPRLLACFHREYPQVRVTCLVTSQSLALQALIEGKVHLALASDPPFSPDIEFHRFSDEHILLIAPLNHPWSQCAEIDVSELEQVDFILPEEGSETHTSIREGLAQLGVSIYHLKVLISLGSLEAIALSVQEGLGVGFVPELVVTRLVKNNVCPIRVRGLDIQHEVFVGRNTRRPATTAQEAFWQFILDPENPVLQRNRRLIKKDGRV